MNKLYAHLSFGPKLVESFHAFSRLMLNRVSMETNGVPGRGTTSSREAEGVRAGDKTEGNARRGATSRQFKHKTSMQMTMFDLKAIKRPEDVCAWEYLCVWSEARNCYEHNIFHV